MHRAGIHLAALALFLGAAAGPGDAEPPGPPPPLPEGDQGIAARHPGDREIDADPTVLFHDDFESGELPGKWDKYFHKETTRITDDPANVHGGRRALECTVPRQQAEISNGVVKLLKPGYDIVFLRYYSKFDRDFDQTGSSHNGGILNALAPGMPESTPGIRADGRNKFIASLENWRGDAATPSPGGLNVYVYHPEQRSEYGDHIYPSGTVMPYTARPGDFGPFFVPRPDISLELGRWYCLELMVQANHAGLRDGRIAAWVDGRLVADFPGLRLRDVGSLKINSASIGLHIKANPTRENKKWYDDVVIATSYIGPMSGRN